MRRELTNNEMENVVGGTVRLNTSRMRIGFTVLNCAYDLHNCEDYEAMNLVTYMYSIHKNEGDLAYEQATLAAFQANGWI